MSRRVHVVMDDELVAAIDATKAVGQSRGDFVRRALEEALGQAVSRDAGGAPSSEAGSSPSPTPPRAMLGKGAFKSIPKGEVVTKPLEGPTGIWTCKIGVAHHNLQAGADWPMRVAVERAYREVTGEDVEFCFSGWGGELDEGERLVVESDRAAALNREAE